MGLLSILFGTPGAAEAAGRAIGGVAEVFHENRTRRMERDSDLREAAVAQLGAEFASLRPGRWNGFIDGLNRLPRPALALGTLALFAYAMADPAGFTRRMQGLAFVPEPLWWLLGAIVGFYFGAREAHHFRRQSFAAMAPGQPPPAAPAPNPPPAQDNPALAAWLGSVER